MAYVSSFGKFLSSLAKQKWSSVMPTPEEKILTQLKANAPKMAEMASTKNSGFTFDPRTGKFLEPESDIGTMMGTQRNLPGQLGGAGTATTPEDIVSVLTQPQNMRRLQRGEYVGAWNPEGTGMGLDTSKRYATQIGSMLGGRKTGQLEGFNLRRAEGFDLSKRGDWLQGIAGVGSAAAGSATGAGSALNYLGQDGELSGGDIATAIGAGIIGAPLGRLGANRYIENIGMGKNRMKGVMDLGSLNRLSQAGVKESVEGGPGLAGRVAKNRAISLGVPPERLADVADTADEATAFSRAYEELLNVHGDMFGALSKTERQEFINYIKPLLGTVNIPNSNIASTISKVFKNTKPSKNINIKYKESNISDVYSGINLRKVRNASKSSDLETLAKNGKVKELEQALDDIRYNFTRFITPEDIAGIKSRNGIPVFYMLGNLGIRARAGMTNSNVFEWLIAQGIGSSGKPPVTETQLAGASRMLRSLNDNFNLPKAPSVYPPKSNQTAYKAFEKQRAKDIKSGDLINANAQGTDRPTVVGDILNTMDDIENDIITFMKNPIGANKIREKIWTYFGTLGTPEQKVVSTIDSWMFRAGFGDVKHGVANSSLDYRMVHEVFNDLAKQLDVPPAALQEVIWKNARNLAQESEAAFLPLKSKEYMKPFTSKTTLNESHPDIVQLANTETFKEHNKRFVEKLVKAVEENPEVADMFEIVGDDVQFTDKFFSSIHGVTDKLL